MESRNITNYDDMQLKEIELQRNIFNGEFELMKHRGELTIFDNQLQIGKQIFNAFEQRELAISLIIAPTQSGKTGSMIALISEFVNNSDIDINNIYIITGISSVEWKEQTINRFPNCLNQNILHRNDLERKIKNLTSTKNSLIIIDETHYACKEDQALYNLFKENELFDLQNLYEHDIKIIQYSATPDGVVYDINKWENACKIIIANGGESYVSNKQLLENQQVIQYKSLHTKDEQELNKNIKELKTIIDNYSEPKYHIIRTKSGKEQGYTITNITLALKPAYKYILKTYDGESKFDLNDMLKVKPKKHTIIFIKEMLRCAKTLYKDNIGVLYERHTKAINSSAIIQGLLGRATGYDSNKDIKVFTDITTIENYNILLENNFDMDLVSNWSTNSTTAKGKSKGTINSAKNFKGAKSKTPLEAEKKKKKSVIKVFDTMEAAIKFVKKKFGENTNMGKEPVKNSDGFYLSTIRADKRVRSVEEIMNSNIYGVGASIKFKLYYAYEDLNNNDTLKYVICCLE